MRHLYDKYNGLKHQIREVEGLLVAHRQQVRTGVKIPIEFAVQFGISWQLLTWISISSVRWSVRGLGYIEVVFPL